MAFVGTPEDLYSHGLGNLFSYPELLEPARVTKTAELIDNLSFFLKELPSNFDTKIYVGSEVPIGKSAGCSVVVTKYESPDGHHGYLGIIGPTRMGYEKNISVINEIKRILEDKYEQKRIQG
jgi:heat-inducible transcriptional repressor